MTAQEKTDAIARVVGGPKYNSVDPKSRIDALTRTFTRCAQRKGITGSAKTMLLMAMQLDEDVSAYYGDRLSADEVWLALEWGTHGEFGEFTGLNADRLFSHIRAYEGSEERLVAFRRARRDTAAEAARVPLHEIRIRNWDSCAEETISNWDDYVDGRFRPYVDASDDSQIPHRHVLADCYLWLKSVGIAVDDDALREEERRNFERAAAAVKDGGPTQLCSMAGAMCLETFFLAAKTTGFDLGGRVRDETELATDEDKDGLRWKSIRYRS